MYFAVKSVRAIDNFQLLLTFANDEQRIFDMKPYLETGVFRELKNVAKFQDVRVSFDSFEWSNYADFDPQILYSESTLVSTDY